MAARPLHLFEAGLVTDLRRTGVASAPAALAETFLHDLAPEKHIRIPFNPRERWLTAARESCRTLAEAVATSLRAGAMCGILGGESTVVAGSISGAVAVVPDLTLVYLAAHGDFNTLATTPSHFVGGMVLAHVCGRSIAPLLWPGSRKIDDDHVALVGGRDLDPGERQNIEGSRIRHIPFDAVHTDVAPVIAFARRKKVWLHIDVDIVDPTQMPAVVLPAPGGPSVASVRELVTQLVTVADVRGFEICGYDPQRDEMRRLPEVISDLFAAYQRVGVTN